MSSDELPPPTSIVPPKLPIPSLSVPMEQDIVNNNNEMQKMQYANNIGVEIYPFGRQCFNTMKEYLNISKKYMSDKNSMNEAIHRVFTKLINWVKNFHFSETTNKKIYKLKPSDIRLFFKMLRP